MRGERPGTGGREVWRAVWSEWEGPGQPPRHCPLWTLYFCAACLPAVGQWVDQTVSSDRSPGG